MLKILFSDSNGDHHPEIFNSNGNSNYKYFYYDESSVIQSMKYAIETISTSAHTPDEL